MEPQSVEYDKNNPLEIACERRDKAREAIFDTIIVDEAQPLTEIMRHVMPEPLPIQQFGEYCLAEAQYLQARIDAASPKYDDEADRNILTYTVAARFCQNRHHGAEQAKEVMKEMYVEEGKRSRDFQLGEYSKVKPGEPSPFTKPELIERHNYYLARMVLVTEMMESLFGKDETRNIINSPKS